MGEPDKYSEERTAILGLLTLHEALLAVLYADHIEHDKKLRDVVEAQESFEHFVTTRTAILTVQLILIEWKALTYSRRRATGLRSSFATLKPFS
jgi:hypothetical protein